MLASRGLVASHVTGYMRPRGKPRGRDTWTRHVHREHDSPSWPEHRWSGHDDLSRCRIVVEEAEKLEEDRTSTGFREDVRKHHCTLNVFESYDAPAPTESEFQRGFPGAIVGGF